MLRAILSVIVAYVAIVILVFVLLGAAYLLLGPNRSYQPGSYEISTLWLVVSLALGFVAALVGGLICAAIAGKGSSAPIVLAAIILLLGLGQAVFTLFFAKIPDPGPRPAEVTMMEAIQKSLPSPTFFWANPFVAAIGAVIGAKLRGTRREAN